MSTYSKPKFINSIFTFVALLIYCQLTFAQNTELNGGLLIFAIEKGERWVLLANYKKDKKKWAGLGGKFDSKWDNTSLDTAIRETSEETFCFYTEAALSINPAHAPIRDQRYITYLVEVPLVPSKNIEKRKKRKSFCKNKRRTKERKRFRWVKWTSLKQDVIRFERLEILPFNDEQSSKELNTLLSKLPGKGNYYHHAFATSLHTFLKSIRKGLYPEW